MPLIDSHCHLADDVFVDDVGEVIARAQAAGVTQALCILEPGSPQELARVAPLRALWPSLRFSVGVHPHHAAKYAQRPAQAVEIVRAAIAANDATRALGEIGLDYHYDFSPREVQQAVFGLQLDLARALDLPVIIHTREADADTVRILKEANAAAGAGALRGVFHCFTGDEALARAALDLGFYLSFSGIATFPRAENLREIARFVPADRRLVETDSPYLAPPPFRGKRNEPARVARVAEILSDALGEPLAEFQTQTAKNFAALFEPSGGGR